MALWRLLIATAFLTWTLAQSQPSKSLQQFTAHETLPAKPSFKREDTPSIAKSLQQFTAHETLPAKSSFKREATPSAAEHSENRTEGADNIAETERAPIQTTHAYVNDFKPIHVAHTTQTLTSTTSRYDQSSRVVDFKPLPEYRGAVRSERRSLSLAEQSHLVHTNGDFVSRLERGCRARSDYACAQRMLVNVIDRALSKDSFEVFGGVSIVRNRGSRRVDEDNVSDATDLVDYIGKRISTFAQNHVLRVDMSPLSPSARNARFFFGLLRPKWLDIFNPTETGKTGTFLTGFGLGFLAFGLKKLLLPIFIAAQIVKSVLIAMFLPTILGGLGKLVGKGVSTFASTSSGLSGGLSGGGLHGEASNTIEDFEFKDQNDLMDNQDNKAADSKYSYSFNYPDTPYSANSQPIGTLPAASIYVPSNSRYPQQQAHPKVSYVAETNSNGNYYQRHQPVKQDYKVFHDIPSSSLLLTTYDPFYSPLLSRLDSVFKQLGYETESCRERLVCAMYRNPAKFAPYSNLVSAQLSRELNELRKPTSDNSEILRFFRYMKAAKNGQDGQDCFRLHPGCVADNAVTHPPMVKTYNDINKLVQARRLARQMAARARTAGGQQQATGRHGARAAGVQPAQQVAEVRPQGDQAGARKGEQHDQQVPVRAPTVDHNSVGARKEATKAHPERDAAQSGDGVAKSKSTENRQFVQPQESTQTKQTANISHETENSNKSSSPQASL